MSQISQVNQKFKQVFFSVLFCICSLSLQAQFTEAFEDETKGASSFTDNGNTFSLGGNWTIQNSDNLGHGPSSFYVDNKSNVLTSPGIVGTIGNTIDNFNVYSLWLRPSSDAGTDVPTNNGTVIIKGKLADNLVFTQTVNSGINTDLNTEKGFTEIDLSAHSDKAIDQLEFELTGSFIYLALDDFKYSIVASNSAPSAADFTANITQGHIHSFSTSDFGYSDADNDEMDHVQISAIPDNGVLWIDTDADGTQNEAAIESEETVSKSILDEGKLKYLTNTNQSSSFRFKVNDATVYSETDYLVNLSVTNAAPDNQASGLSASTNGAATSLLSWTNGNGESRIVFIKEGDSGTAAPVDNSTYAANSFWGGGNQIESSGWYCVYKGSESSVNIEGLKPNTSYQIMVCEYNGSAGTEKYLISSSEENLQNIQTRSILINEVDAVTGSASEGQFVELYDGGQGNTLLDGLTLIFYNGNGDKIYYRKDLDGQTTDAQGYFVFGNDDVQNVDCTNSLSIQDGADAVAVHVGNSSDYPVGDELKTDSLVDALVYGTDDEDDSGLLILLNEGEAQINESASSNANSVSNQRSPNGAGGLRNTSSYIQAPPTPGEANMSTPSIQFSAVSSEAIESVINVELSVQLSFAITSDVSVNYAVSGGTASASDYNLTDGTLTISAGQTLGTINLKIENDALDEVDESIEISLSAPVNAELGSNKTYTYTIQDDDDAPSIAFKTISSAAEESIKIKDVLVELSSPSEKEISVDYSVGGTATNPDDFILANGVLNIPAGQSSANISITEIVDDELYEGDESIILTLSSPSNAILGDNTEHTFTITENDPAPLVTFTTETVSGEESVSTVDVQLSLSAPSALETSIPYTVSGTATANDDFTLVDGKLSIAAGQNSGNIQITNIIDDETPELNETIIISLGEPVNASLGSAKLFTYTIIDNDSPSISFASTSGKGNESETAISILVELSNAISKDVEVQYEVSGTATVEDHNLSNGSFTIEAGNTQFNLQLSLTNDDLVENDESIVLSLTSANNANLGTNKEYSFTIEDNDHLPVITASQSFTIDENSSNGSLVGDPIIATDGDANTNFTNWTIQDGNTNNAFDLDAESGQLIVKTASELDFETTESYTLNITVSDGTNTSEAVDLVVNVNDLNDNTPVITAAQSFTIDENSSNGTLVGNAIIASDGDANTNFTNWTIQNGNTNNAFNLDPESGQLIVKTASELDFETRESYTLSLTVSDGTNTSEAVDLVVNVNDLNDNTPVITAAQSFTIDENSSIGTLVGNAIKATDEDANTNFTNWTIQDGNINNAFDLDAESGQLIVKTASELDFETTESYTLNITVSDGTNTSEAVDLVVNIYDLNDNTPVVTASQSFSIDENSSNGSLVGDPIIATDGDANTNFTNWTIQDGNINNAFDLDAESGQLRVKTASELDFETTESYTLSITVSDGTNTSEAVDLVVNINDLNDNTPVITAAQSFTIDENSSNGTLVGNVIKATDEDANTNLTDWSIQDGNINNAFDLDPESGQLRVKTTSELDFETTESYTLSIRVSDGTNTSEAVDVVINVNDHNDNKPVITAAQSFTIDENSSNGTLVGNTIKATDSDANTNFTNWTIQDGNINNAFNLDPESGQLTVKTASELDFETRESYTLNITVSDGANTSEAVDLVVNVNDLNDNAPIVKGSQLFHINENAKNETSLGIILASDKDANTSFLDWTIISGNTNNVFKLNAATGELKVNNEDELDYETTSSYTLAVKVSDGTYFSEITNVQVKVNNENGVPIITASQIFTIDENSLENSSLGFIQATDEDNNTVFSNWKIKSGNDGEAFKLIAETGELQVNKQEEMNYEGKQTYTLSITVSDGTNTSLPQNVFVNLNDLNEKPVVLKSQSFNINENSANETSIGIIQATDEDKNSSFSNWMIISGNINNAFQLNPSTGELSVNNSNELNHEETESYSLRVSVSDGTNTSLPQELVINVNDVNEKPVVLSSQSFNIDENSANETSIGIIQAVDEDEATSFSNWTIESGNTNGVFSLNPSSGKLQVNKQEELNYEDKQSYTLSITVSDGNNTSSPQDLTVNVNDINEKPVVQVDQSFSVSENATNETSIGTLIADDEDANTVFSNWTIVSGNTNDVFVLNPSTAELLVNNEDELDFESTPSFTLKVTVSDGAITSDPENVLISVHNQNGVPIITASQKFEIDENAANDMSIGIIEATDEDANTTFSNWTIKSGNTNDAFELNSSTGELSVKTSTELDFETSSSYTLSITVSDGVNTSQAEDVVINLNDLNDNKPVIEAYQQLYIDENSSANTSIGLLKAKDGDANTVFADWIIESGNINEVFSLDPNSGELKVNNASELDFEKRTSYALKVRVSDGVNTSELTNVEVFVNDLNDNIPVVLSSQSFEIDENSETSTKIGRLKASDEDANTSFSNWTIVSGNIGEVFALDPATGELSLSDDANLDFESQNYYLLSVNVSDGVNTSANKNIIVLVNNVNEAPTANAGKAQTVAGSASVTLDGTASTDPENDKLQFAWTAPEGISLSNAKAAKPSFIAPELKERTDLEFKLTVNDGELTSVEASVIITVEKTSSVEGISRNESQFKLYPNPSDGSFYVEFDKEPIHGAWISINTLNGETVYSVLSFKKLNEISYSLERGIYMVKIQYKDKVSPRKLIIY